MFDIRSCGLDDLSQYEGAANQMLRGEGIEGVIVRGAFPAECIQRVLARLAEPEPDGDRRIFGLHGGGDAVSAYTVGLPLTSTVDELDMYFEEAVRFNRYCQTLFGGEPDFKERVESVLQVLAGDRKVGVPHAANGSTFAYAGIRVCPPTVQFHMHCGLDLLHTPHFAPLRDIVDDSSQLSYFVLLSAPASGGELVLHNVRHDGRFDTEAEQVRAFQAMLNKSAPVPMQAGDMLVFDGGRIYHQVSVVGDGPTRVTIGGFAALSKDHSNLLYWN